MVLSLTSKVDNLLDTVDGLVLPICTGILPRGNKKGHKQDQTRSLPHV